MVLEDAMIDVANEWEFFLQLLIAAVLGGLVGLERQFHGRPAGLRTHILVCLGSAVIIIAIGKLHLALQGEGGELITMDPARAAAGIITGIGFLGAGTILKGRDFVVGLTTAASIWVVAAIGITIGLGQYYLAATTTILVLFALFVLDKIDIRSGQYGDIGLEGTGGTALFERAREQLGKLGFTIKAYNIESALSDGSVKLSLTVRYRGEKIDANVVEALSKIEGVRGVSWGNRHHDV